MEASEKGPAGVVVVVLFVVTHPRILSITIELQLLIHQVHSQQQNNNNKNNNNDADNVTSNNNIDNIGSEKSRQVMLTH